MPEPVDTVSTPAAVTRRRSEPLETALEIAVELLEEIETATPSPDFYSRLCTVVCRLTTMERAGIWLYDSTVGHVSVVGVTGIDLELLGSIDATAENTPLARRALEEDRVVEVSDDIEHEVPAEYATLFGLTTLTCTPLAAGGNWFGVLIADRGGGRFTLTETERNILRLIGRILALATSTRIAVRQQERARRLADRLNLAREIHEQVIQRLFGVSLVLSSGHALGPEDRDRLSRETAGALADLRTALQRPLARSPRERASTLRAEVGRLDAMRPRLPIAVSWPDGVEVPAELESLAQSVLAEAVRNVRKHADPGVVEITVRAGEGAFELEVRNDGARAPAARAGMGIGLRLAAFDALQHGGVVEFGAPEPGWWRVRLVVPEGRA